MLSNVFVLFLFSSVQVVSWITLVESLLKLSSFSYEWILNFLAIIMSRNRKWVIQDLRFFASI